MLLDGGGVEDGVALGGGEGEALGDDGVLAGTAGNLQGSAEVLDGERRAARIGAGDREPADGGMRQIERRIGRHQLADVGAVEIEIRNAGGSRTVDFDGQTAVSIPIPIYRANIGERVRGEIVIVRAVGRSPVEVKGIY